jgi:hypothetical protein
LEAVFTTAADAPVLAGGAAGWLEAAELLGLELELVLELLPQAASSSVAPRVGRRNLMVWRMLYSCLRFRSLGARFAPHR